MTKRANRAAVKEEILIIDDDESMCDEVSETLRDEGYRVSISKNGLEGAALIATHHYDVILLDIKLPGLSGYDILRELEGKMDGFRVIVITGQQVAAQLVSGEPSGDDLEEEQYRTLKLADGILSKPFDMSTLLHMIGSAARRVSDVSSRSRRLPH